MYYNSGHVPVARKGKILSNPHCYNGLSNPHCMNNPAHYGVILGWVPKTGRLAKCERMQYWYEKYIEATEELKELPSFLGIRVGPKVKAINERRRKYERYGDAAWSTCKKEGKVDKAETKRMEMVAQDFSLMDPSILGPQHELLATAAARGGGSASYVDDAGARTTGDTPNGYEGEMMNPYLIYGAIGGAGLLLILLLRRRK